MNPTEQKERSTAVHAVEVRLTEKFDAVIEQFDVELERLARARVADLMTISGLEHQIVEVDAKWLERMDAMDERVNNTISTYWTMRDADIKSMYESDMLLAKYLDEFRKMGWWERIMWMVFGEFPKTEE